MGMNAFSDCDVHINHYPPTRLLRLLTDESKVRPVGYHASLGYTHRRVEGKAGRLNERVEGTDPTKHARHHHLAAAHVAADEPERGRHILADTFSADMCVVMRVDMLSGHVGYGAVKNTLTPTCLF